MRDRRSSWTGRPSERLVEVRLPTVSRWGVPAGERVFLVEPEHEAELRRFVGYAVRFARPALALFLGAALPCVVGAALGPTVPWARWLVPGGLLLLGGSLVAFPFATPETVAAFGLRRSRSLARGAGLALLAMAVGTLAAYAAS